MHLETRIRNNHEVVENRRNNLELQAYKKNVFLLMRKNILKQIKIQEDHRNYTINLARKRACYWIKFVNTQNTLMNCIGNFSKIKQKILHKKLQVFSVQRIEARYLRVMRKRASTILGRRRQDTKQVFNIYTFLRHDRVCSKASEIMYHLLKESAEIESIKDSINSYYHKI